MDTFRIKFGFQLLATPGLPNYVWNHSCHPDRSGTKNHIVYEVRYVEIVYDDYNLYGNVTRQLMQFLVWLKIGSIIA